MIGQQQLQFSITAVACVRGISCYTGITSQVETAGLVIQGWRSGMADLGECQCNQGSCTQVEGNQLAVQRL